MNLSPAAIELGNAVTGQGSVGLLRVGLSLLVCLALALLAALLLKRVKWPREGKLAGDVHVQGMTRLDARTTIYLIRCSEQSFLLAQGTHGVAWVPLRSSTPRNERAGKYS